MLFITYAVDDEIQVVGRVFTEETRFASFKVTDQYNWNG